MQINQFDTLSEYSSNDYFPVSHGGRVFKAPYGDLALAMVNEKSSSVMRSVLENNSDLNNVKDAGIYRLASTNTYVNMPMGGRFAMLEVIRNSSTATNLLVQVLYLQGGLVMHRFYLSGSDVWTAWGGDVQTACTVFLHGDLTALTAEKLTIVPCSAEDTRVSGSTELLVPSADGGIKIGPGVSRVMVSGAISWDVHSDGTKGYRDARIVKNSDEAGNSILWARETIDEGHVTTIYMPPTVARVTENDILYMMYYARSIDKEHLRGTTNARTTYFTVEVIG